MDKGNIDARYVQDRLEKEYEWKITQYTNEAKIYGKWLNVNSSGNGHNDSLDAFRHAYASARATKEYGEAAAMAGGFFHEAKGQFRDITSSDPKYDQPLPESVMDIHNNQVAIEIGKQAQQEGWSNSRIAEEVKKALDDGKLILKPSESVSVPGYSSEDQGTPSSSALDQIGNILGEAGKGLLTVGNMALDTALNVGRVGLESALEVLARGGQIPMSAQKFLQQNVAKVVLGQIMAQLQAKAQTQEQGVGIWGGMTRPFERDPEDQVMIERMMNDRQNEILEGDTMQIVMQAIQRGELTNPLEAFLAGLIASINDAVKKQREEEKKRAKVEKQSPVDGSVQVNIAGVPLVVDGGCLRIVLTGAPLFVPKGLPGNVGEVAPNGEVHVHAYSRGKEHVREHTRGLPDGDLTNNRSASSGAVDGGLQDVVRRR